MASSSDHLVSNYAASRILSGQPTHLLMHAILNTLLGPSHFISDPNVLIERSPLGEFSLCLLGCPLRSPLTIHCYVLDECVYEPGLSFSLWVAWFSMGSQG